MKRLLAILLVALMLLSLAACGDNSGGKTPDGNDNTTPPGQTDTDTPGGSENNPNVDIPTEDKVEIKGDSVIQTSVLVGGGYQTVEYSFDGNVLKNVTLTSVSAVAVDQKAFNELKKSLEGQGYDSIELNGKTITAVCTDLSNSGYAFFANMGKENLKATLEGNPSGGDVVADYRINWSDIKYLPDGMPKLADKVTDDLSDASSKMFSVTWNLISKADMEAMKTKLEQWSGLIAEKLDMGMPDVTAYSFGSDTVMITIYYYDEPMVGMAQCSVTVSIFEY